MFQKALQAARACRTNALVCHTINVLFFVIGTTGISDRVQAQGKLVPVYPITESGAVSADRPVLVLPPQITHDSFDVRRYKRDVAIDEEGIANWIYRIETRALQVMGLTLLDAEDLLEDGASAAEIVSASETIVRRRDLPEDFSEALKEMARGRPGMAVLLQHLKIKLAPKGSWDSFSGAMTVGMSNSDLKGVILDCETGEVLWQGEVYIRMIPQVGNARFEAAVAGIFQNLAVKESQNGAND